MTSSSETSRPRGTRVIFINRYFAPDLSATSQMLSDLAFSLAERGFQIVVVTSRMEYDAPERQLPPRETLHGVDVRRVWTTRFGRHSLLGRASDYLSFYFSAFVVLMGMAGPADILVAKTDPPLISIAAALVARLKGARLVNWLQDVFPEVALQLGVLKPGLLAQLLRTLRNWSLRHAATNVAIGSRMARFIAAEGASSQSIRVIPNWADGRLVSPVERGSNPLRREWALDDTFVVGYSGNLGRAHEYETMLGAAQLLQDSADLAFLFIGGGKGNQELREEATRRGVNKLMFKPYQPQSMLAQSLSIPDVHLVSLLPSMEGLIVPSKIYGIAAAGRPCIFIGDPQGEVAEILNSGGFGVTVAPGDASGLADAIKGLKDDPARCLQQSVAARAVFDRTFTRQHAAAQWADVLSASH